MASFPYPALLPGEMRLLTISSTDDGTLSLSLAAYRHDESLEYDALSYSWGPRDAPKTFTVCNGWRLYLSFDLLAAIETLKSFKTNRKLWIDYICIDQLSEEDKQRQIPLMRQFYTHAKKVWIWIGPCYGISHIAMQDMKGLASKLSKMTAQPLITEWLEVNGLPSKLNVFWDSLDSIFSREWFDRLWTMQEFALAENPVFVCGSYTAAGSDVVSVAILLCNLGLTAITRRGRIPRPGFKDGYHFATLSSRYNEAKDDHDHIKLELALQLARFKESRGSGEHDRIYAILGLVDPEIATQIEIDYKTPFYKLYIATGKLALKSSTNLALLAQCQSTWRPDGLPSWCPNFHAENEASPFFYESFSTGFLVRSPVGCQVITGDDTNRLRIKGARVAVVTSVANLSEKWDTETGGDRSPRGRFLYISQWMEHCLDMAEIAYGRPSSDLLEGFIRTCTADFVGARSNLPFEELRYMWESAQVLIQARVAARDPIYKDHHQAKLAHDLLDSLFHVCRNRRFFLSTDTSPLSGAGTLRMALGPDDVNLGDEIAIFQGANMPFVLRELKAGPHGTVHNLLGPAYVRGVMRGQVFEMVGEDQWEYIDVA